MRDLGWHINLPQRCSATTLTQRLKASVATLRELSRPPTSPKQRLHMVATEAPLALSLIHI
eukprot:14046521-Alexandrium_andersonii.AAC.1